MLPFEFYSPTKFVFGPEAEMKVGTMCRDEGYHKVLIVTGQHSVFKSGLYDRVVKLLDEAGVEHVTLKGVKPNPAAALVYEGTKLGREAGVDLILGLGGGSAIDTAKAIGIAIPYEGDFWDFYSGKAVPEKVVPIASILTLPATGTEASNSSVITNEELGDKRGVNSDLIRPVISWLNPTLSFTLPLYQVGCGITDMMAHILERYLTNTKEVKLTDELSEATLRIIIREGARSYREPENYEARANVYWAGTLAHNNLLGIGREQDWSSHQLEHELSTKYGVAHGAGLAIVMPNFMYHTLEVIPERYARLATEVWGITPSPDDLLETGREGIRAFQRFLRSIGMPLTLQEIGGKEEDIPELARNCNLNNGDRLGYLMPLDQENREAIYRRCFEEPEL